MRALDEYCYACSGAPLANTATGFTFEPVSAPGRRTDELWQRIAPSLEPMVARTAAYLQWKYVEQPFMRYELFHAVRDGQDRALLVTRQLVAPEPNAGVIAELLCAPDDRAARSACIAFAVNELSRRGCNRVVASTSRHSFAEDYVAAGFSHAGTAVPYVNCPDRSQPPVAGSDGGWFMSQGDADGDQYPRGAIRMTIRGLLPRRDGAGASVKTWK